MNEVYALDPLAELRIRDLKFILDQCGFREGRFLARLPKGWERQILERFSGQDRARALVLLQKASLLECRFKYDPLRPWLSNAIDARLLSDPPIESVITDVGGNGLVELNRLLDDPDFKLKDSRGAHINRTVENYLFACDPLFRASGEVFLIDKFFTCWNGEFGRVNGRHVKVLKGFLDLAAKYGVCQRLIIINSREVCLRGRTEDAWACQLEFILKKSRAYEIRLDYAFMEETISDQEQTPTLHARYICSRLGGLQFDHGFDIDGSVVQKNHVHWMSSEEFSPVFRNFSMLAYES